MSRCSHLHGRQPCTFIHQALCSPPTPALLGALVRSFKLTTIQGLTPHLIKGHLPPSTATNKGHMRWHCQGVQTTRMKQPAILQAHSVANHLQHTEELFSAHNMFCFAALADLHTGTMYTNSTSAFPVPSFCNMQYVFVAYIYNLNAILVCAMPSKTNGAMIAVFTDILANLNAWGYAPALNLMDNECSKAVKAHIWSNHMDIHLISPHNHQVNDAERAIAMFKGHFISALTAVNRNCLLQLWDDFLPQVELTLNLLQFSQQDPTKPANKEVNGKFDYNKTPLAPLGAKGLLSNDMAIRASWAPHGTDIKTLSMSTILHARHQKILGGGHVATISNALRHTSTVTSGEHTILEVTDTLTTLGSTVPTSTSASIACTQAIQKLYEILLPTLHQGTTNPIAADTPSLRVLRPRSPATPEPRVPMLGPSPRVMRASTCTVAPPSTCTPTQMPTTLHDPTMPSSICLLQPVHQQHTQNNNPFAIFADNAPDNNGNDNIADDLTIQADNCTNDATLSTSLQWVHQPARRNNTLMILTNPHASPVHDLWPTATPTLIPQPRLLQSTYQ
jgi:hypothetical protein